MSDMEPDSPAKLTSYKTDAGETVINTRSNGADGQAVNQSFDDGDLDDDRQLTLPDAIDLVLNELNGETADHDEVPTGKLAPRKLQFDEKVEDAKKDPDEEDSCSNPVFRYKVMDTLFLFWNTTTMGWVYGQMGPSLPDLQVIAGVRLQAATWLFTGFAIGYLGGCLLAGIIQDKFNPRLMLFLYTLGTGITIGVLPWIPEFIVMVIIRVINGICMGGQDTGIHSMLFAIWLKDGGPFIQMTHCLTAAGGILAPLVTQPFVSDPSASDNGGSSTSNVAGNNSMNVTTTPSSVSRVSRTSTLSVTVITEDTAGTMVPSERPVPENWDTNIHYAFLICGILVLTAAVPFLIAFLSKRRVKKTTRQYSNESVDKNKLPKNVKKFILCVIFVNSFVATAYIDLFPSFLVTFVIEQLNWTQQPASTLTSVFFGTYGIGNFIGVFILAYITSTKLIAFSYISSGIMLLGVLVSVLYTQTELIWITVALSGITMSSILPTLFSWTQENVTPITGRMASGLLISGSAGVMVNPLLLGYMMDVYSPMWFIYLSLGETVFCALLFTTAFTLSRMYSAANSTQPEVANLSKSESPVRDVTPVSDISAISAAETSSVERVKIYPRGALFGV